MPSLEAVEQFKSIVKKLANEPQIRAKLGLPAEEITPPEAGMSQDLASLIGGMPTATTEADTAQGQGVELESDEASEETGSELEDVFGSEVTPEDSDAGPSMDDLLGPAQPEETSFEDPFATPLETVDDAAQDLGLGGIDDALGVEEEAFGSTADQSFGAPPEVSDFGNDIAEPGEDLPALDDFGGFETPEVPDMGATEDAFGPPPVANTSDPSGVSADEEFEFAADGEAGDFPELAGFANTKEEDVEAFDALGVAEEFGLGDFESQFGITADDQADPELLNPAQSIDAEIEAAQKTLSLTEEEFLTIRQVLGRFPLNLRLAVEEAIGEKALVFDDLDKVVRLLTDRAPVRTIASTVGKILGRKIVIPPGFEKGTGEQIEARQATLWYNMRTIMFPIVRVSVVVTVVVALLVVLGWNYLLKPWKANDLYEKGLAQIHQNNGLEADDLFAQAYYEWPAQDRFFQFASAYLDTGDY